MKTCKRCNLKTDNLLFHDCVVKYTLIIQKELERLWFIYGNSGPKCTMDNHKFIQRHIEGKSHEAKFYKPTEECREAVKQALLLK
jgi:hypothetical protein